MANTESRRIVAGPSREELFDALRLFNEGRKVTFTVAPSVEKITQNNLRGTLFKAGRLQFNAIVTEIAPEDGSGNRWLFKLHDEHAVIGSQRLTGYINTTRREGWVKPLVS